MTLSLLLAALAIFVVGNIVRSVRILRAPAHVRWDLYPIPKGPRARQSYGGSYFEESEWWTKPNSGSRVSEVRFVLKEVFLLHGVRRNFRALWPWSMALHWGLYLYAVSLTAGIGIALLHVTQLVQIVRMVFAAACLSGCAGTLGLLVSRLQMPRLKPFTTRSTLFNLVFLFAIFSTGAAAEFLKISFVSVATLKFAGIDSVHLVLLSLFLIYCPFTHMTHMFMKYFTWHCVRWDDIAAAQDSGVINQLPANLARPISWYAAHISGNDPSSWADAVSKTEDARNA